MKDRAKRILVVDDEPHILKLLDFLLSDEGYEVETAETGEKAIEICRHRDFDVAVIDLALPGIDGFTVCKRLQKKGIPILMLSSYDDDEYVIAGLEIGAVDYVKKPFNHRELILRIAKLIERESAKSMPKKMISSHVEVDLESEQVKCRGKPVRLTPNEYLLLVLLMRRRGAVVSWDEILHEVWNADEWDGARELIKVNIRRLRMKIEENPNQPRMIVSQWGRGYRFLPEVTVL